MFVSNDIYVFILYFHISVLSYFDFALRNNPPKISVFYQFFIISRKLEVHSVLFLYPTTKRVARYYLIPSEPFECPSVRPCFVSGLEQFLTDFLQTLHGHWYQGGVVWDCKWAKFVNKQQSCGLDRCKNVFFLNVFRTSGWILIKFCVCFDIYKIHVVSNAHYFWLIFNRVVAIDLCKKKCIFFSVSS